MKKVTEAISSVVDALPGARTLGGALLLKTLMAGTAAHADTTITTATEETTITTPADFDSTYNSTNTSSYVPASGADCLGGVQPHNLTGGLGFRSDVCAGTIEQSVDGDTFTDITSAVSDAITDAGYDFDGSVIGSCDYSAATDKLLVFDGYYGNLFTVEGLDSGSITSVTKMEGTASGCGSIDESTGAILAPADTGSQIEVAQFSATSTPVALYSYGSTDTYQAYVSTGLNQAVFSNNDAASHVYFDANISSGSTTTAVEIDGSTVYVTTFGLFEASETGGDPVILLADGSSTNLDFATFFTVSLATDPDTDGDGDLDSIDCDDTDATINSTATEMCDGVDNDCDGSTDSIDSADLTTWYEDADGDGLGNSASTWDACEVPTGYVSVGGDPDDTDASIPEEPVVDTGDSGDTGTVSPVCLTESPAGPYEAPDSICLGTGALIGVDQQDVIYDGSQTTTLDEMFDGITFEATDGEDFTLDSLDINGWTFEPDFVGSGGESVDGEYVLGVSGFAEGAGTAILTITSGQMIATDASGHSEPVTVGTWSIPDESVVDDTGGEGDADTDVDSDTDTDSGTEDTDSGSEDTDTDSGTGDTDTDEEKKIKPAEPVEDTAICATVSVKTGWVMALTAAAAALLRRRRPAKQAA